MFMNYQIGTKKPSKEIEVTVTNYREKFQTD